MAKDKKNGTGLTKGKPKKEVKIKKDTLHLRCDFTPSEINEKAKTLASENKNFTEIENDKKSVTSDFAARLAECRAKIDRISNNINCGYELRRVNVEIRFHDPVEGKKTIVRLDSNEIVETVDMLESELQEELDFNNSEKLLEDGKKLLNEKSLLL